MKTLIKSSYKITNLTSGELLDESEAPPPYAFSSSDIDINYDYQIASEQFSILDISDPKTIPHIKYSSLMPLSFPDKTISLGEGNTPLFSSKKLGSQLNLDHLFFKFEGANPTGSFKDRGSVIEVSKAARYQTKAITVASTGNMAASISAYSAAAGIPCYIFVPQGTPETKLAQTLFYGGKIIQIKGTYDDAAETALKVAQKYNFYLAGDYSFRAEGQKSQSYEIYCQLDKDVPDYLITPVGNGTNIFAVWKGFKELFDLHLTSKIPHMIGVQVEGYDSIYQEWSGLNTPISNLPTPTCASAIAVKKPGDKNKVLNLINQTQGCLVSVANSDVITAQIKLAQTESILAEPSSSTAIVALEQLHAKSYFPPNSKVVCLLTGIGLKDVHSGLNFLSSNISTASNWSDIEKSIMISK